MRRYRLCPADELQAAMQSLNLERAGQICGAQIQVLMEAKLVSIFDACQYTIEVSA
jgi:hypothetical protein